MVGQPTPLMLKAIGEQLIFKQFKFTKMQTKKMSLANIQGKLSRTEMKNIMAGTGDAYCIAKDGTGCGPQHLCCWNLTCDTTTTGTVCNTR